MIEQRVASGEHEAVEIAVRGKALEDCPVVDADADRLDGTASPQRIERPISTAHGLRIALLDQIALPLAIDVMDQHDVDGIGAQALHAVLQRAHRGVVAVVVADFERSGAAASAGGGTAVARVEQPTDLGRQHDAPAIDAAQARAEAMLGEAGAVERRNVEIAKPAARSAALKAARGNRIRVARSRRPNGAHPIPSATPTRSLRSGRRRGGVKGRRRRCCGHAHDLGSRTVTPACSSRSFSMAPTSWSCSPWLMPSSRQASVGMADRRR